MNANYPLVALTAFIGLGALVPGSAARTAYIPDKPVVRFLLGSPGAFNQSGFIEEYARAMPNIELVLVESTRKEGLRLAELQYDEADLVLNASQASFLAFSGQLETTKVRFDRLRAISALGVVPMHLVAAATSGIRSVPDLSGKRVRLGSPGSENYRIAMAVLASFGVDPATVRNSLGAYEVAASEMSKGNIDAMFIVGGYPAEAVRAVTAGSGAYLVPIDGAPARRARATSGFLHPSLIPAGTYAGQTAPVRTVGIQNLLVTRRDLDEQIVYELTKHFFAALPKLSALVSSLRHMDVHAASATSIPLHEGAARYYRERELFR